MKPVFVENLNVKAFRTALSVLEDAERGTPGLAVVWGQAGRGKTCCAREYAVRTGAVYLRAMQDQTPTALLSALAYELNGSEPRTTDRARRIICQALDRAPRTVLMDEADRMRLPLIECLRDIHDQTGTPIILIGEERLFPILNAQRRLWSRVTQTVEFKPVTAEDVQIFLSKACGLGCDALPASELVRRSGGDFRLVYRDAVELERMARANALRSVSLELIKGLPNLLPGRRAK